MLTFEGDFTINRMRDIKSEIQKQFNQDSSINIVISSISEMDITFLQLLLGLESGPSKVTVGIEPGSKEKIREFIKSYGYQKELNMLKLEN